MPGKRRKLDEGNPGAQTPKAVTRADKPLSAIVAARLRSEATTKSAVIQETPLEPLAAPSSPPQEDLISEHEQDEAETEPEYISRNIKLCNWTNDPNDVFIENESELSINLNKHSTISLLGHYDFRVLKGAININGANIGAVTREGHKAQVHRAYVPATHPITKIRGLDTTNHIHFTSCKEPTPLAKLSPLFEGIWNTGSRGERQRSFGIITDSQDDILQRPLRSEACPDDWLSTINEFANEPSVTLVTGSPESGKSTFGRRLLNRYLTGMGKVKQPVPAVCYLDLDPVKGDFNLPGQISLVIVRQLILGPSFTRPATIPPHPACEHNETVRSHPIPANLTNYQDYYHECVEDLYLAYRNLFARNPSLPLFINTPGFLYTSHFQLLEELLGRFKPQNVVHLGDIHAIDSATADRLHTLQTLTKQHRGTLHEIAAQASTSSTLRTNAELRAMQMQSYFHLASAASRSAWTSASLSTYVPWEFSYCTSSTRNQDFVGFISYNEPTPAPFLLHALNGSIIHIVQSSSAQIPTPYTNLPRTPKSQIPYFPSSDKLGYVEPLDPRTSRLVCVALVRGFVPEKGVVQILVPKSHEDLLHDLVAERTVFVTGCSDTPEWAYMEDAYGSLTENGENNGEMPTWVEKQDVINGMGYLAMVRRVRKFQTGEKADESKGR